MKSNRKQSHKSSSTFNSSNPLATNVTNKASPKCAPTTKQSPHRSQSSIGSIEERGDESERERERGKRTCARLPRESDQRMKSTNAVESRSVRGRLCGGETAACHGFRLPWVAPELQFNWLGPRDHDKYCLALSDSESISEGPGS